MEENRDKVRIEYIDIAKGAAILLVIIGHTIPENILKNIIYSFHMPLFFFVSGYFFKHQDTKKFIVKYQKRLLLPYAVTSAVIILLCTLKKLVKADVAGGFLVFKQYVLAALYGSGMDMPIYRDSSYIIPNIGGIWFLPALFIASLILNQAVKYKYGAVIVIFSALFGVFTDNLVWLPFSIQPAMVSIVYLYFGWCCRKYDIVKRTNKTAISIDIFVIWFVGALCVGSNNIANNYYEKGILNFFIAFLGILTALKISILIERKSGLLKKLLLYFGNNTLIVLCVHITETKVLPWWEIKHKIADDHPLLSYLVIIVFILLKVLIAYFSIKIKKKSKILSKLF